MTAPMRASRVRPRRPSAWHLLLAPIAALFAFPLVNMIATSFMTSAEINRFPRPLIPSEFTTSGFVRLFTEEPVAHWLLNSLIVTGSAVISQLILCSLAGYGFARLTFRGREAGFVVVLTTIMIPTQVLMIPTYVMFARVGVINTLLAAIIPWMVSAFGIFLMRQFFLSLPRELEEAASIDGAGPFTTFWRVILPMARPALATLAIFAVLGAWNDLLWPLVAINDPQTFTIQLGLTNFQGSRRTDWSLLMAGNVVATLPLLISFVAVQKQFIQTMALSGLK
jgi:multiple sugar transport system permease protein